MNDKHKSYSYSEKNYALVSQETELEVHRQLREGILPLYQALIKGDL